MANRVTIKIDDGKVVVQSPYHPDFPPAARQLGGKWRNSCWNFAAKDEARVRALCQDIYGTDGSPVETVTLRLVGGFEGDTSEWYLAGRQIARKRYRDCCPDQGDGVVVIHGEFLERGGSRNYPKITYTKDLVVEIRDVPLPAAEREVAAHDNVSIVEDSVEAPTLVERLADFTLEDLQEEVARRLADTADGKLSAETQTGDQP